MKQILFTVFALILLGLPLPVQAEDDGLSAEPPHSILRQDDFARSMRDMRAEMDRLFNNFFQEDPFLSLQGSALASSPATDIIEQDGHYIVKIEMPGVGPGDVDLSVSGNTIVLKGEKQQKNEFKSEDYLRREMSYGSFSRAVSLPPNADMDKADAQYDNGVLTVTVPKKADADVVSKKLTIRKGNNE